MIFLLHGFISGAIAAGFAIWWIRRDQRNAIDSLIQEIKQDPSISISQRNYAIKKMEELAEKL